MKRHTSTLMPGALAAVLIFAACGSDDAALDDGSIATVPDASDDSGLRAPVPIEIAGGGDTLAAGESVAVASDAATSDMMIAPVPWITDYVVGDGLPALPDNDVGYVFDAGATATAEQVRQLAAALGVVGDPVRVGEVYGASWRVGPDDGSAPNLWLYEEAQLTWNYNGAWAEQEVRAGCAVSVDSEGNEYGECPEIEPPQGVPTAAEAEQLAVELLTALGEDATTVEFDTFADDWFANVTATRSLDGIAAGRSWNFGFGADGVMQFAGGTLAVPERVGPYPLIDLDTAISRLKDRSGFNGGFGGSGVGLGVPDIAIAAVESGVAEPAVAVDVVESDVAVDVAESPELVEPDQLSPAEPDESLSVEPTEAPPVEPSDAPMPVEPSDDPISEPMPIEPETVVVTLVDVQADLWWAWDADGAVWLLPAYRFIDADGGWHLVPAVTDEFLIQVDPSMISDDPLPMPAPEPLPVAPDGLEAEAEEPVIEPTDPLPGTPGGEPQPLVDPAQLDELVGMSLAEFEDIADEIGYSTRVVVRDGEALGFDGDHRETRANVAVEDDIVVAVEFIG